MSFHMQNASGHPPANMVDRQECIENMVNIPNLVPPKHIYCIFPHHACLYLKRHWRYIRWSGWTPSSWLLRRELRNSANTCLGRACNGWHLENVASTRLLLSGCPNCASLLYSLYCAVRMTSQSCNSARASFTPSSNDACIICFTADNQITERHLLSDLKTHYCRLQHH